MQPNENDKLGQAPGMPPDDKLTPKQRAFVEAYIRTKHGVNSAREAGYKGEYKTLSAVAVENLEKPLIKRAIFEANNARIQSLQISHDTVIGWLQEVRVRSMQQEPVLNSKGEETGEYRYDSNGAIRASELIGKHFGMWKKEDPKDDADDKPKRNWKDERERLRQLFKRVE